MSTQIIRGGEHPSSQKSLLSRHPILSFFIMAYGFTWIIWSFIVLSQSGLGILPFRLRLFPLGAVGPFVGPMLSACIVTAITEGRTGVVRLLSRYVQWRVGFIWYPLVLLGVPALQVLGMVLLPGELQSFQVSLLSPALLNYLLFFVPGLFLYGPFAEELGWRGFALPRLQQRYGPFLGAILLGILWGLWHSPLYLLPSYASQYGGASPLLYLAQFIVTSVFITWCMAWVYNNTKESLLIMILFHTSLTFQGVLQQVFPSQLGNSLLFATIGYGAAALLILLLTKGRLSYQQVKSESP